VGAERPIEPNEAFGLGALHGILLKSGVRIDDTDGIDINSRSIDVYGLVPANELRKMPCIRITVEEVQ
jgi:hypothetical protein